MEKKEYLYKSPDGKHIASLENAFQIRMGAPFWYDLVLDDVAYGDRRFGGECLWSPDSRFFLVKEVSFGEETSGFSERLLAISSTSKREFVVSQVTRGELTILDCKNGVVIYQKDLRPTLAKIVEYESDLPNEAEPGT